MFPMNKKSTKKTNKSHTSLYRTHRPASFSDVRGQDHIVKVLEQTIEKKSIGHAYLFTGSRGTGKTSVARIFSHAIGCSDTDLYEIDAASNRGIDDIRELREGVYAMPFESPYKVYIIDEVHMLTKEAFNALLKTLEEPPSHAVFILATTELHKVPDTIQSRCEVYLFKQPSRELLAKTITEVAKKEGSALESDAADLIALLAEGSFRDALGILQKSLIHSSGKKINREDVEIVSGAPRGELIIAMLQGIVESDVEKALGAARTAIQQNMDARVLTKLLMHHVRATLLMRYVPNTAKEFEEEFGKETLSVLKEMAEDSETRITSNTLRELLSAYTQMTYATLPYVPLELAIIDLIAPKEPSN